jgi:hypothetical protein
MWPAVPTIMSEFQPDQLFNEARFVFQTAQIEAQCAVLQPADDGDGQVAESFRQPVQRPSAALPFRRKNQAGAGQEIHRQGATADLAAAVPNGNFGVIIEGGLHLRQDALRHGTNVFLRPHQQAQCGQLPDQPFRTPVKPEGRFQGGQGHLVHPQGAFERVALDLGDQVLAADQDAGLRPAQELVTTEDDNVGAGGDGLGDRRLTG